MVTKMRKLQVRDGMVLWPTHSMTSRRSDTSTATGDCFVAHGHSGTVTFRCMDTTGYDIQVPVDTMAGILKHPDAFDLTIVFPGMGDVITTIEILTEEEATGIGPTVPPLVSTREEWYDEDEDEENDGYFDEDGDWIET